MNPGDGKLLFSGMGELEGPVFFDGAIWCVEMDRGTLVRFADDGYERIEIGGTPNGLAVGSDRLLYICDNERQAVLRFDPQTRTLETVVDRVDGVPCRKANDLAFDAAGNLVFTCPQWPDKDPDDGFVACVRPDGTVTRFAEGQHFWNGLAFADGGRTLYIADSADGHVWKGHWDAEACRWLEPVQWVFTRCCPDGMAADRDGNLLVAVFNHACVKIFSPEREQIGTFSVPGKKVTNLAFDPDHRRIVVTEISRGELIEFQYAITGSELFTGQIEPLSGTTSQ